MKFEALVELIPKTKFFGISDGSIPAAYSGVVYCLPIATAAAVHQNNTLTNMRNNGLNTSFKVLNYRGVEQLGSSLGS
jgi:hypothetical protein